MRMGRHAAMGGTLEARVDTLEAWMRQRGHVWIDVLKLDVEGAEYSVLEDLAQRDVLPFSQLLVEFHQRWLPDQRRHQRLLARLQARGVRKVHVHNDQEIAFLNDRFVELSTPVEDGVQWAASVLPALPTTLLDLFPENATARRSRGAGRARSRRTARSGAGDLQLPVHTSATTRAGAVCHGRRGNRDPAVAGRCADALALR